MSDFLYHYDSTAHDDASNDIHQADMDIRAELDACDAFAMSNIDSWSGALSRQEYDATKAKWNAAAAAMGDILAKASPTLQNIKDNYHDNDRRIQQSLTS